MELLGVSEVADLFGVTKQVIGNWRSRKHNFPAPAADLKSGPVWAFEAITGWATEEGITLASTSSAFKPPKKAVVRRAVVAAMMNMKGGVGKSTMTANVGWYAAYSKDKRVLLIDLDPQFNLSQYILGIRGYEKLLDDKDPTVEAIFVDASGGGASSNKKLIQRVKNWDDNSCIHLIPANLELAWSMRYLTDRAHLLHDYIEEVREHYDLIVIDCAPTESILSTAAYLAADYIFVPVKPEFLSTIGLPLLLRSMDEFKKTHRNSPVPELGGIIFNDTGEKLEHDRSREYVSSIAAQNALTVFENEVSHSDSYPAGARVGKPIFLTDNARSWKKDEFNRVAAEFLEKVGL